MTNNIAARIVARRQKSEVREQKTVILCLPSSSNGVRWSDGKRTIFEGMK